MNLPLTSLLTNPAYWQIPPLSLSTVTAAPRHAPASRITSHLDEFKDTLPAPPALPLTPFSLSSKRQPEDCLRMCQMRSTSGPNPPIPCLSRVLTIALHNQVPHFLTLTSQPSSRCPLLLHPHWPSSCPSNTLHMFLPQGLARALLSAWSTWPPRFLQIYTQKSPSQ